MPEHNAVLELTRETKEHKRKSLQKQLKADREIALEAAKRTGYAPKHGCQEHRDVEIVSDSDFGRGSPHGDYGIRGIRMAARRV